MNNDNDQIGLDDEEYVTKTESYSTIVSAQEPISPKYDKVDTRAQNAQYVQSDESRKRRLGFHWGCFLAYLPSWMKHSSHVKPNAGKEVVAASKSKPPVQLCQGLKYSPIPSCHHKMHSRNSDRRSIKTPSCERVLCNYNFDDQTSDKKLSCERCKQKDRSSCGTLSYTEVCLSDSKQNTKRIQIDVAETSSYGGTKERTTNRSCGNNKQTPTGINSLINCCQQRKRKRPSTDSTCRDSLLEQAWAYLQAIIAEHRSNCLRCNDKSRSNENNTASKESISCKKSLLEQARDYLQQMMSAHKDSCQRCQQEPSCLNSKDPTSHLPTMLEQAWLYLKKLGSNPKICCQNCKSMGRLVCCRHSSTRDVETNKKSNIFKNYISPSCFCNNIEVMQSNSKKKSCVCNDACRKICRKNSDNTLSQGPDKLPSQMTLVSLYSCICSSQTIQASKNCGSHDRPVVISRPVAEPQKPSSCTQPCKISTIQSVVARNGNEEMDERKGKHSTASLRRGIIGYQSSTVCCLKKISKNKSKQGITLKPKDSKSGNSTQPENKGCIAGKRCDKSCSAPCNPNSKPEPSEAPKAPIPQNPPKAQELPQNPPKAQELPQNPPNAQELSALSCPRNCANCNSEEIPMYIPRMVDKNFLNGKNGTNTNNNTNTQNQTQNQETIWDITSCSSPPQNSQRSQCSQESQANPYYRWYW